VLQKVQRLKRMIESKSLKIGKSDRITKVM